MSVHKSLVSKMSMSRERNVYKREERLAILKKEGRLKGETHVVGLPKTKVAKALKKAKTEKKKEEGASSSPAKAAPAAAAAAPAAKGGDKKAAAPAKK